MRDVDVLRGIVSCSYFDCLRSSTKALLVLKNTPEKLEEAGGLDDKR